MYSVGLPPLILGVAVFARVILDFCGEDLSAPVPDRFPFLLRAQHHLHDVSRYQIFVHYLLHLAPPLAPFVALKQGVWRRIQSLFTIQASRFLSPAKLVQIFPKADVPAQGLCDVIQKPVFPLSPCLQIRDYGVR